jgi:hypothetical protein
VLTAWTLHLVLVAFTQSQLAGAVAAWTFLTTRWLFWEHVRRIRSNACLELFPLIVAVAARPDVRIGPLLALVVLQCLQRRRLRLRGLAGAARGDRARPARATSDASRRHSGRWQSVLATPVLLAPVLAGYVIVAAQNPDIALQTNWRGLGSTLFPWLGQHLTELPWGPIGELAPTAVAPVAILLVLVGLAVVVLRGAESEATTSLWRHALVWTVVGFVISLTPAVTWGDHVVRLPHAWLADWKVVNVLREPGRLAMAALIGLSLLAGLAFARCTASMRATWRVAAATLLLGAIYVQYAHGFSVPFRRQALPAAYPTTAAPAAPALVDVLRQGSGTSARGARRTGRRPLAVLPRGALYRSIYHRRPIVNGYAGYWPRGFLERMALAGRLPDPTALAALQSETGLTTIVVHQAVPAEKGARAAWEKLAADGGGDGLELVARVGDDLVFAVRGANPR